MNSINTLTSEQIHAISQFIKESCSGRELSPEMVAMECGALAEDIAGMESLSETELQELIHHVWSDLSEK